MTALVAVSPLAGRAAHLVLEQIQDLVGLVATLRPGAFVTIHDKDGALMGSLVVTKDVRKGAEKMLKTMGGK